MICEIQDQTQFRNASAWSSEYEGAIESVVSKILGRSAGVEEAVQTCLSHARGTSLQFTSRGEFGSWILRLAIHEALGVLRRDRQIDSPPAVFSLPNREESYRWWFRSMSCA